MHKRKIQGDHGCQRLGLVEYNLVVPLPVRCKLGGEVAKQLGEIAELKEYSQQHVVSDHHDHPVSLEKASMDF